MNNMRLIMNLLRTLFIDIRKMTVLRSRLTPTRRTRTKPGFITGLNLGLMRVRQRLAMKTSRVPHRNNSSFFINKTGTRFLLTAIGRQGRSTLNLNMNVPATQLTPRVNELGLKRGTFLHPNYIRFVTRGVKGFIRRPPRRQRVNVRPANRPPGMTHPRRRLITKSFNLYQVLPRNGGRRLERTRKILH